MVRSINNNGRLGSRIAFRLETAGHHYCYKDYITGFSGAGDSVMRREKCRTTLESTREIDDPHFRDHPAGRSTRTSISGQVRIKSQRRVESLRLAHEVRVDRTNYDSGMRGRHRVERNEVLRFNVSTARPSEPANSRTSASGVARFALPVSCTVTTSWPTRCPKRRPAHPLDSPSSVYAHRKPTAECCRASCAA